MMRTKGKQLDQTDRDRIKALLDEGYGIRKIGRTLDIPHSTVSREIARNSYGKDERTPEPKKNSYDPTTADHKAYVRRKYSKYQGKKINDDEVLQSYIIAKLRDHWSPDEISGHMKLHSGCSGQHCYTPDEGTGCSGGKMYTNKNTIYEWLDTVWGQEHAKQLYSYRHGRRFKKKKKTGVKRQMIPDRVSIDERPVSVANLTRYFHWEQDAVVSGKRTGSKASLSVLQERKTKYIHATVLPNMKPTEHVLATRTFLQGGAKALSITYDNGIENLYHNQLHDLGVGTYFADPYSSYQKAMVENANKMIRRYYPKGTDFAKVSQTELNMKIDIINKKPRKSLGFRSALQLALEKGVIGRSGAFGGGI